jgi:uncharacterized Zn-finger protein
MPGDGLSPGSNQTQSTTGVPPYTPGYVWSPSQQGNSPSGFQQQIPTPASFGSGRGPLSPPIRSYSHGSNANLPLEGVSQHSYDLNLPPFPSSGSMSAPTVPSMQGTPGGLPNMMGAPAPVSSSSTAPSPVSAQEPFGQRAPPTPGYYQSQPPPHQGSFPYSTGPSPTQQSPISAGPMSRMSPTNGVGMPHLQSNPTSPHHYQRPFGGYPLPGPVLSNVSNPGGGLQLVGGMPHGLMPGFNSGHAAGFQHMYGGHHAPQQQPHNDRPFKCDQCPQSFNRNHDLKRHKRIHLAVKPFPCGHCEKSFSRKDALKVRFYRCPLFSRAMANFRCSGISWSRDVARPTIPTMAANPKARLLPWTSIR